MAEGGLDIAPERMEFSTILHEINLTDEKKVQLKEWRGDQIIDIRLWREYPTKTGICLTPLLWKMLCQAVDEVEDAVYDERHKTVHLGGPCFVIVNPDMKRIYLKRGRMGDGEIMCDQMISLTLREWIKLSNSMSDICKLIPNFDDYKPCFMRDGHSNQLSILQCADCNPFTFMNW
jgi:hypothetical protein